MSGRTPVAVLGATGLVGRRLVQMLQEHPWLEVAELVGSPRTAGLAYRDVIGDGAAPATVRDPRILDMGVRGPGERVEAAIALSALPAGAAGTEEPRLAAEGLSVSSNASFHRTDPRVPLLVPEVNPDDVGLVRSQPWRTAGGALVTNPNCVVAGLAPVLAALDAAWGVEGGVVVTLQALSGAGVAGPSALALAGNVVPHIAGEEEKIPAEVGRILGRPVPLAVTVNRVPVVDGHLAHLFVRLGARASPSQVTEALDGFQGSELVRALPSAPQHPIRLVPGVDRPQPRLDAEAGGGMEVSVGRVRVAPGFDVALTLLVHNLVRGAAGACLLNAELLLAAGVVAREPPVPAGIP